MLQAFRLRSVYKMGMSFQRAEQPVVLRGVEAARAFFAPCMTGQRSGDWWVAHVDERVRCIHLAPYPAEDGALPTGAILADAVRLGSAGVLLASCEQPGDDLATGSVGAGTRLLARFAEAANVTLLDHLVFSEDGCTSLRGGKLSEPELAREDRSS